MKPPGTAFAAADVDLTQRRFWLSVLSTLMIVTGGVMNLLVRRHGDPLVGIMGSLLTLAGGALAVTWRLWVSKQRGRLELTDSTLFFAGRPLLARAKIKQAYGFVLYRTTVAGGGAKLLKIKDLRDYAVIMVNGKRVGTLDRRQRQDSLRVPLPAGSVQLDILVENMGRVNFGKYLLQNTKGITKSVSLGGKELSGWRMYGLPFDQAPAVAKMATSPTASSAPVLRSATFTIATPTDTYLDMRQWGKGSVWLNGHNLGRYWAIGPQQTLYVPAEWLRKGANTITVLELLKPQQTTLATLDHPILSELRPAAVN